MISSEQSQTKDAFGFKWAKRETYESPAMKGHSTAWLFERYCQGDRQRLASWLAGGGKTILDAGCGAGYSALLFFDKYLLDNQYIGVDISDAAFVAESRFKEAGYPGRFYKADLLNAPVPERSIDLIFSEGVLHHCDNTREAILALAKKLKRGGRFLFYVYAKKAVIREFTDDFIREKLKSLDNEAAWAALMPLTKLGKSIGDLNIEFEVPEDIPFLGIKKGKMNLQRFIYWNVCKMFYRPEFSLDEMNHINFDWFRPLNCHRQSPDEVKRFCSDAGLQIETMNVQEAGITVVARLA